MKKKKIITILIAILLILGLWKLIYYISNKDIITAGNDLYGVEKCNCGHISACIEDVPITCKLCGYKYTTTGYPELCGRCSDITGRCMKCGKKLKIIDRILYIN